MNGSVVLFYVFAVHQLGAGLRLGFEAQYNAWPYHTSLTLGLLLVIVQLALIRPGWNQLVTGAGTPTARRAGSDRDGHRDRPRHLAGHLHPDVRRPRRDRGLRIGRPQPTLTIAVR